MNGARFNPLFPTTLVHGQWKRRLALGSLYEGMSAISITR